MEFIDLTTGQSHAIAPGVVVTLQAVQRRHVFLGVEAKGLPVYRAEVWERIQAPPPLWECLQCSRKCDPLADDYCPTCGEELPDFEEDRHGQDAQPGTAPGV